jgi:hypothetical protein
VLTRLDDKLIDHTKIEEAAGLLGRHGYLRAFGAACWAIVYANRHLTDGFLPARALEKYGISRTEIDALVRVGVWDSADNGVRIHDFLDWNPSASEVKAKQSRDRERKREAAGFHADSTRIPDGKRADSDAPSLRAYPQAPAVTGLVRDLPKVNGHAPSLTDARFETFWDAYPNKANRKGAAKVFARLEPDHELLTILIDAVKAQAQTRQWKEGFVPHAQTWLNGERWKDVVLDPIAPKPAPTEWVPPRPPLVRDLIAQGKL